MKKIKDSRTFTAPTRRCPVVYKGTPLSPMRWIRVKRLSKLGKGVLVKTKTMGIYFKLKVPPSDYRTPEMSLGIDPGAKFNGFSVTSPKVHNANFQRNTFKKDFIQKHVAERREFRRERRLRLRHRPCRNASRTGHQVSKTTHYLIQVREQMVKDILFIYPISKIIQEDVAYNHYASNKGAPFSNVEVGKNLFREFVRSLNLSYFEIRGIQTKRARIEKFGHDLKCYDKSKASFFTHSIDSFVLSSYDNPNQLEVNKKTLLIEELSKSFKRKSGIRNLREFSGKAPGCQEFHGDFYRYSKGGIKYLIEKYHKVHKYRVKLDDSRSNHGPWRYEYRFTPNTAQYVRRDYLRLYGSMNGKWWYNKFKGPIYYDNYLNIKLI